MPSRTSACVNHHDPGRSGCRVTSPQVSASDSGPAGSWLIPATAAASPELKSAPSTLAAASRAQAPSSRLRSNEATRWLTSALPAAMRATASASAAAPGWAASTRASVVTYSALPSERTCTNRASSGSVVTPAVRKRPATAVSLSGASRRICTPGNLARSAIEVRQGSPAVSRQVASRSSRDPGSSAATSRRRNSDAWSAHCRSSRTTSRSAARAAPVTASAAVAAARNLAAARSSERALSELRSPTR